jgi:serine protease Do
MNYSRMRGMLPAILLFIISLPVGSIAQPAASDSLRQDIETAKQRVYPAIVNIAVIMRLYSGGRAIRAPAGGSGVVVSRDGYVLTNYHVAGHTTRITCTLPDGEALEAKVVLHDPLTDLSVLKLDTARRERGAPPIPFAKLGDSEAMRVGDYVLAMGNPLTLSSSITLGIVSNTHRVFTDFTGTEIENQRLDEGETTGLMTRWIQHDALILPGNSGGPLVNLKGDVIGINELGGNGFGFAIPSNLAAQVLKQAISGTPLERGWLGFTALPTTKLGRKDGALVAAVLKGSPAEKGGLRAGDILLSIDGAPVNARFFEELPLLYQKVASLRPGSQSEITYLRDGVPHKGTVVPVTMEESIGREEEFRDLGVTLQEITGPMALERRYPDRNGVVVTGVRPGYPLEAAQPPLAEGDVIFRIGSTPVDDLAGFQRAVVAQAKSDMLVAFRRNRELMLTVVKPKADTPDEEGIELPKAWLGVKTQVVTPEVGKALGLAKPRGFRVTRVYPWSKAAAAGIRPGDILTSLEKQPFAASRLQDEKELDQAVENLVVGQKAEIGGLRDKKPITFVVEMEATPAQVSHAKKAVQKEFEFSVRDLVPTDIEDRDLDSDQKGVLVTDVTSGGWASIAGLRPDDIILAVDEKPTLDVAALERRMDEVVKRKPRMVSFFVVRANRTHFVFAEPDWDQANGRKPQ